MRSRCVQLVETGKVFKSLSECDKFLGSAGLTATILQLADNYHPRYKLHINEISFEVYSRYKDISDNTYQNIVNTYEIECKWCGKPFHPANIHQHYCNSTHYQTCVICGKQFDITKRLSENKDISDICSKQCAVLKRKRTISEKQKDPAYEQEKLKKRKQTCLEKYGVDNVAKSGAVKTKIVQVLNEKYGVDNPAKLPQAKSKLEKYYHDPEKLDTANRKREATNLHRFGATHFAKTLDSKLDRGFDLEHAERLVAFYKNPEQYIQTVFDHKPTAFEVREHFLSAEPLQKLYGSSVIRWNVSTMEQELTDFILSLNSNIQIKHQDRTAISPLELDIYLPDYKIAFECNPTITHNSTKNIFGEAIMGSNYHKLKTDRCEESEIFLFHIFGHQWSHRRPQVYSMIRNTLKFNDCRVYARDCAIKQVDSAIAREFLNMNHIQGYTTSSIALGLYHDNILVSLMLFRKLQNKLGVYIDSSYELTRFCSLRNYTVVGGASKLFKYFITTYKPNCVRSFSNRSYASGNLYNILNFDQLGVSQPRYVWVDEKTDVAYHSSNTYKSNLRQFLHDGTIDLTKTEKQIMEEHGFLQVFDSGVVTWEWTPNLDAMTSS